MQSFVKKIIKGKFGTSVCTNGQNADLASMRMIDESSMWICINFLPLVLIVLAAFDTLRFLRLFGKSSRTGGKNAWRTGAAFSSSATIPEVTSATIPEVTLPL